MRCKLAPFFKSTELFGLFAILLNPRHATPSDHRLIPRNDILQL